MSEALAAAPVAPAPGVSASGAFHARAGAPAADAARDRPFGGPLRWGLLAVSALACLLMLGWPLGYDQGIFASNGDIVARGGAPYRDAWDVKGPLVFYLSAAIQLLFGRHAWGIRVVDVGIVVATAVLLWRRLRPVVGPGAAFATAAAWPAIVAGFTFDEAAQYDGWVGAAMLGVTVLATRPEGYRARDLVLGGALVGLASLTKPVYPALLAVPGAVVLVRRWGAWGAFARDVALLVAGFAAPVAAGLGLLAAQGALRDAWDVHIMYNLRVYSPNAMNSTYPSESLMKTRALGVLAFVLRPKVVIVVPAAAAGAAALWRRDRPLAVAVIGWMVVGVALVALQAKFWPYHWELIYPGLLVLVALGVVALADELGGGRALFRGGLPAAGAGAWLLATTVAAASVLWCHSLLPDLAAWARHLGGLRDPAGYYGYYRGYGEINPADDRAAAAYLRARTPPGAPFAHWTINGGLAFYAGRPNVARVHNKRELTRTASHPVTQAYRREYLARVAALRPTYVILGRGGDLSGTGMTPWEQARREFPELASLVAERYAFERRFGDLDLYRLRAAGTPAAPAAASPP